MKVSQVEVESRADGDVLSGTIGEFRLWLRVVPGGHTVPVAEPFLTMGLLVAMARGESLELDAGLTASPRLLAGLDHLQSVFSTWNRDLRTATVSAAAAPPPPGPTGVGAFFSGGVDSLYTFAERQAEITHLVHLHGFDYRRQNRALAEEAEAENRAFASAHGRQVVSVESNFRELYEEHRIHANVYHGAVLAGVGQALGFSRVFVPASFPWSQLVPWGSHPVTDPSWSTESVEILHHGNEARRLDKLRRIADLPGALDLLRVCPTNTVYSCGVCEKCLRTRVSLRLLGLTSPRLPPLDDLRPIRKLPIRSEAYRLAWQESLEAAVEEGDRPLARAIAVSLARFDARRALRSLDRALLGSGVRGLIGRLRRLVRGEPPAPDLMELEPRDVEKI